ncbi:hypothetical protein C8Q73DRAFT_656932 [Cubamyces lactineus]|nr:hypothetical protein C8Q73DRAFT_656932 [Cubamyces lactineus]
MDPEHIADIARRTHCTHIHPGYGFLSESPNFAALFQTDDAITFVGPSVETLEIASDKMRSRSLAASHGVPVAPGAHVSSAEDVRRFTDSLGADGFPIIIKALDGGGGRGIRLIYAHDEVEDAFRRCIGESASRRVFVEKAYIGPGWRHIEVQIVGDGHGNVTHLWERECSIQRRFQKLVEMAPSTLSREAIRPLIEAALKMARHLSYAGLGTFEFLMNGQSHEWIFLEINPRVQVEHTVTEEVMNLDLVRVQLLLSLPGVSLASALPVAHATSPPMPQGHAIQLRLVAEDPQSSFHLSVGSISARDVQWPSGRGVRVDTWLCAGPCSHAGVHGQPWSIGVDFDSLLAKIVVHAGTSGEATARALRALRETRVQGAVKTNVELLAGIVTHPDWSAGIIHTGWLEDNVDEAIQLGRTHLRRIQDYDASLADAPAQSLRAESGTVTGTVLLQPGASFQLLLSPSGDEVQQQRHTMVLSSIGHNAFPSELSGTISTSLAPVPMSFSLKQLSAIPTSSQTEFADPRDPTHVASPIAGKIVEVHPALQGAETGGSVELGDALVVVSVMKMESVVKSPASARVVRVGRGIEVGSIIGEGTLLSMSFMDEIRKIPPVTRFLCAASLAVTVPVLLQLVHPYKIVFVKEFVTQKFEIWRIFTSFFMGSSGINFIFDFAML